jgi:hypothetical protein
MGDSRGNSTEGHLHGEMTGYKMSRKKSIWQLCSSSTLYNWREKKKLPYRSLSIRTALRAAKKRLFLVRHSRFLPNSQREQLGKHLPSLRNRRSIIVRSYLRDGQSVVQTTQVEFPSCSLTFEKVLLYRYCCLIFLRII